MNDATVQSPGSDSHQAMIGSLLQPHIVPTSLAAVMTQDPAASHALIIECNADYPLGIAGAKNSVREYVEEVAGKGALARDSVESLSDYVFVQLDEASLRRLLQRDGEAAKTFDALRASRAHDSAESTSLPAVAHRSQRAIRRIWRSTKLQRLAVESIRTVKVDAAHAAFGALGDGIVWAVLDSGVDATHPHFVANANILTSVPLAPKNFTTVVTADPLKDAAGHGTHVAGIIAGACASPAAGLAAVQSIGEDGTPSEFHLLDVTPICGMAPKCKILSLRIFDDTGDGDDTAAIQALEYVMQLNAYGTHIRVHGVNLSAGYLPDYTIYGIGQSPLCKTIDRVVRSGVVVVCAAGNFGWTPGTSDATGSVHPGQSGALASIADPGNASLALTVGSTHRERPHAFGISFFSSKGPTVDGRMKPDVVAPGERIISCATGALKTKANGYLPPPSDGIVRDFAYAEDSGTSMAAPHVSGVVAAFLSVRREFIGEPELVCDLVRSTAIDLKRDLRMQGSGLVDLFGMLQNV